MSKVLSVYNDWAFYEVVLPSVVNTQYSFLLDAELFHLYKNELVELECIQNAWCFSRLSEGSSVEPVDIRGVADHMLPDYGRYHLTTNAGEVLTVLVEEKDNPLYVYKKYVMAPNQVISIGMDSDNAVSYRYPVEKTASSFVSRHHCKIHYDGTRTVLEDTSSNGTYINNIRINGKRELRFGDHIRVFGLSIVYLGNILAINSPAGSVVSLMETVTSELEFLETKGDEGGDSRKSVFYRAPRTIPKINSEVITIDPPPNPKEIPQTPLFMQIGPAMTMTIPMLLGSSMTVIASRVGGLSSSPLMYTGIISAVSSAIIGIFWAVTNVRYNKKRVRKEEVRFEKYGQYLINKQKLVEDIYRANTEAYRKKYVSSETIADYDHTNEKLWSRNFNHSDVLTYRVGLGDVPSPVRPFLLYLTVCCTKKILHG